MSEIPESRTDHAAGRQDRGYRRPRITRLGTLAELTQGGDQPVGDGNGGAGASF
ncbi:lasso RiPP family leader peptide-containing protein [Micromonospora sp. NPDC000089]|uniref:lasso RiPP family leader peptide-containing protein n=1 Tax=unclassified Micromonospora TaxID=2617518 RepID=UPI0036B6DF97